MSNLKDFQICEHIEPSTEAYKNFSSFIKQKRKEYISPSGKNGLSTDELADFLNLDYEYFRKVVGMSKGKITKKRDQIIAICAALKLDSDETSIGLKLYNDMDPLNEYVPRDLCLMNVLDNYTEKDILSTEYINGVLSAEGFAPLDLIRPKGQSEIMNNLHNASFKIMDTRIKTFKYESIENGFYDTLGTQYDPARFHCSAGCILIDKDLNAKCLLNADTDHGFSLSRRIQNKEDSYKTYNRLEETGRYQEVFCILYQKARQELSRLLDMLHDTKNYKCRFGAHIQDGRLHSYVESYNYSYPEFNEYYLVERLGNNTSLQVYGRSKFMSLYLSPDHYSKYYRKRPNDPTDVYPSIDGLDESIGLEKNHIKRELLKNRKRYFLELLEKLEELQTGLITRKYVILDNDIAFEFNGEICSFYGVESEFECESDPDGMGIIIAGKDKADISVPNIGTVTLSLNELNRAFELGITDINEVCKIKNDLGSIEKVLS